MVKGYNKANIFENISWIYESKDVKKRPCIFLSHKKEDKVECRKIAEYFKNAEIDYYLDELDVALQQAALSGDPTKITESIKKGIRASSHMLVVVSENTFRSQWVPFEIGYGHFALLDKTLEEGHKEDKIKLSILTLKNISETTLPDFMQVGNIIRGTNSLNQYISAITGIFEKSLINEKRLLPNGTPSHPLDSILNWKL